MIIEKILIDVVKPSQDFKGRVIELTDVKGCENCVMNYETCKVKVTAPKCWQTLLKFCENGKNTFRSEL